MLRRSLEETAQALGADEARYRQLVAPFLKNPRGLLADVLGPVGVPRHPLLMMRFGLSGIRSAATLARRRFLGARARALLAGLSAHSILPLERSLSSAVVLLFLITAHVEDWPVAKGGSVAIARSLAGYL